MNTTELFLGMEREFSLQAMGIQGPPVGMEDPNNEPKAKNNSNEKSVPNEHCPAHQFPACPIPSYILKLPPRKAPAPVVTPAPTAAESAVSLEFLRAFLRRIPGGPHGGSTMARVVEELIRPSTSATLSSYASQPFLIPRSHVSAPNWIVIHSPDLPVADLVAALEDLAAGLPAARTYFWLRALAVSQHLMGASAALQPIQELDEGGGGGQQRQGPGLGQQQADGGDDDGGGGGGGGNEARSMAPVQSFGTMLRKRQLAVASKQRSAVRAARLEALAATRGAVAAAKCGAVLVVGRDVRPLRRGWCLVEAAEVLRNKGPEAITVLPVDKAFTRADLVRQLRELDVAEAVAEAEDYDKEVLSEVLGVPMPRPPLSPGAATEAKPPGDTGAAATVGAAADIGIGATSSRPAHWVSSAASDPQLAAAVPLPSSSSSPSPLPQPHQHPSGPQARTHSQAYSHSHTSSASQPDRRASGSHRRSTRASATGSASGGGVGPDPGEDDGYSGGRALMRQLQLVLLLRPMDGALPARMLGTPLGDANPVATNALSSAAAAAAAASNTESSPAPVLLPGGATTTTTIATPSSSAAAFAPPPCGFDWLWDWGPLASWLALPRDDPNWQALLITGSHGSGKTTAMAAVLARLAAAPAAAVTSVTRGSLASSAAAPLVACHFCSAADARSLVATEVVRSLAYQLSCRSPGFGAALCRSLLQLGGAGGGLGWAPDGWLQGLEDVVAVLLRRPLEQDSAARAARGDPPATYLLLLDGLDEGPASAASTSALMDGCAPEDDTGPPTCPGPYQVLRLLVDHLQHLPGVRLVLSCTEAADAARSGGTGGAAAAAAAFPRLPYDLPPPVIVAPRIAADASTSVHLAVRQTIRPREVPLTAMRRDKHLPLALAHSLQEYVLSPELTARELLWQARGCLAHVHILQLLVKHAAEQLGPAAGLPDGTAIAAAATAANAAVGAAAAPATDGPAVEQQQQQPLPLPAAAAAAAVVTAEPPPQPDVIQPPLPPPVGQQGVSEMPQRPRTPPRQDQAGLLRQQSQRRQSCTVEEKGTGHMISGAAPESEPAPPESPRHGFGPLTAPPPELASLGGPNTGGGVNGVHVVPPICRGSLADEYGVLWHVRTAELQDAAMVALAKKPEVGMLDEEPTSSPQQPHRSPRRMDTMLGLTAAEPPPPPYPPERGARLQLLVDALAAAQEPLEWSLLARVIMAAEVPSGPAAAAVPPPPAVATTPVRTTHTELRSLSPAGGDIGAAASPLPPGSPSGARSPMPRRSTPLGLRGAAASGGGSVCGGIDGGEMDGRRSNGGITDQDSRTVSPVVRATKQTGLGAEKAAAAAAASALRDLEWALQEGPLAELVWITGCGRVTVRHSSFLDWLRRSAGNAAAAAATAPPGPPAAAAAAAAVISARGGAAATTTAMGPLLSVPRAQAGHSALARLLRQQLLSGRLSAAATAAPPSVTPLTATMAAGIRRPGSGNNLLRSSMEAAGSAAAVALGLLRPSQVAPVPGPGLTLGLGNGVGSVSGSGRLMGPPASAYCFRHVVTHCVEGRLSSSELETTILDLDFWRQVLEGSHLEMVVASLEHLLRTRGPNARRTSSAQQQQQQQQQLMPPGMLPRTPPPAGAAAALIRGAPTAAAASTTCQRAGVSGVAAPAAAAAAAAAVAAPTRDSRSLPPAPAPLPAATSSLLRDTVLWLLQDGRSLMRRPDPLMLACSASCTPLQSPFRRLAEQTVATAVAMAAAEAADALFPPPHKLGLPSFSGLGSTSPLLPPASPRVSTPPPPPPAEPLFPPSFVTAMPHPRFRSPVMRTAECPHRVTGLLASPDGEVVLASGECSLKASLMDSLSGRRAVLLHAGRGAHHSALSAPAFATGRPLLATAGASPGSVTLWDLTTGAPRATLYMRPPPSPPAEPHGGGTGSSQHPSRGEQSSSRGSNRSNVMNTGEPSTSAASPAFATAAAAAGVAAATTDVAPISPAMSAMPSLASMLPSAMPSIAISSVYPALSPRTDPSPRLVSIAAVGEAETVGGSETFGTIHESPLQSGTTHGSQAQIPPYSSNDAYVSCIAIYEPGVAANATAYGAPPGTCVVPSSAAAAATGGGGDVAIVRGSALVAAGDSCTGRVVLWAVAPDGWGATRTAELVPPAAAGAAASRSGGSGGCGGGGDAGVAWLGFLHGGRSLLVVQSCSTTLRVWNVQSHNVTATLRLPAACGEVFAMHIAPRLAAVATADAAAAAAATSDTLLAAVCTNCTELWALDRRQQVASLPFGAGGEGGGRAWADACVAFSPAGSLLATAGALRVVAPSTASSGVNRSDAPATTTPPLTDPCASTLWDARSGAQVMQLRGLQSAVRSLAFSPDGALLATAVAEAAVVLWSAATGACLSVLPLAEDVMDVPAVTFARHGAVLLAAGGSAVYTWDVHLAVAAAPADAAIGSIAGSSGCMPAPRSRTLLGGGAGGISGGGGAAAAASGSRRAITALAEVSGHRDRVTAVCFSPNGALALTGGDDSTLRLWDVVRHSELVAVEQPGAVLGLAWSPDGTLIAAGLSNGTAHVWHFGAVTAAADSTISSGAAAAAAAAAGDFTTREAARLRCSSGGDGSDDVSTTMDAVNFSADGKLLLTANGEGLVSVWSVRDWQQVGTASPSVRPSRAAISRSNASGESEGNGSGSICSVPLVGRYAGAAFSIDGRWVVMGCGREVMLWSVKSKRESSDRLGPHGAPVVAVATSPCGKMAAVGAGSTVTIWGRPEAGAAGGGGSRTSGVSFRPNPADGGGGGPSSPFSARLTLLPALAEVTGLAFSADGAMLAASLGDGSVRVWATGRWREVGWLSAHGAPATCVAFSPDGRVLLSGGADSRCLSWSARDVLQPVFVSASGAMEGA